MDALTYGFIYFFKKCEIGTPFLTYIEAGADGAVLDFWKNPISEVELTPTRRVNLIQCLKTERDHVPENEKESVSGPIFIGFLRSKDARKPVSGSETSSLGWGSGSGAW